MVTMEEILEQIKKDFFEFTQSSCFQKDDAYLLFEERMFANIEDYDKLKKDKETW
jgi:hypothetical protein